MRTRLSSRDVVAAAALICLAADGMFALAIAQGTGPTRIKIAAGTVSADDTRAGLVGVWTPDDDRVLPADANHVFYLADGLYLNPFHKVALIGFWSATADTLTMAPFDVRQLATGNPAPEIRQANPQISWDTPTVTKITWLAPDRFQDDGQGRRRATPVHDVAAVHRAVVVHLLRGSWTGPGGATLVFEADGTFREQTLKGTYDFDAASGLLRRTNSGADATTDASRVLQTAPRAPSRLRWTNRDIVTIDSEQWTRQPCASCTAGRGYLGVRFTRDGVVVEVLAGSPAERGGLRAGDRIDAVNGATIRNGDELITAVQALAPGSEAGFTVIRSGSRLEQRVLIGSPPQ